MPVKYEHVPGFFHSDILEPVMTAEEALSQGFGLLDAAPDRWETLKARLARACLISLSARRAAKGEGRSADQTRVSHLCALGRAQQGGRGGRHELQAALVRTARTGARLARLALACAGSPS